MTGFGSSETIIGTERLSIQIKSLNNRFLEVKVRNPREFGQFESKIINEAKQIFRRGYLEIGISRDSGGSKRQPKYDFNDTLALHYKKTLERAQKKLRLKGEIKLDQLLDLPDLWVSNQTSVNPQQQWKQLRHGLVTCMRKVEQMRTQEGLSLEKAILRHLSELEAEIGKLKVHKKRLVLKYEQKLKQRLSQLLTDQRIDKPRLYQEVAYLIDRSDVTEEMDRLKSHFKQFRSMVKSKGAVGRNLDFLTQEMNREVNTIASKIQDVNLTRHAVASKTILEKIREQIQNVE